MIAPALVRGRGVDRAAMVAVPLAVVVALQLSSRLGLGIEHLIGLVAAGLLLALMVRSPTLTAPVLLVLLPVQTVVFALAYANGVGAAVLRPLAGLKELAVLALVIVGERDRRRAGRELDALDRVCLAYLGLAVAYFLFGRFLVEPPGHSGAARLAGFREDVLFVVLFHGVRNAAWSASQVRQVLRWLGAGVAGVLAFAVWHQLSPVGFTSWLFESAEVVAYLREVLGLDPVALARTLHHFQEADPRLMGAFLTPISLADHLLIPLAMVLAAAVRGRLGLPGIVVLVGLVHLVLETRTRIDTVSMAVMVVAVVAIRRAARPDRRVSSAVLAVLVAVVAVPSLVVPTVFGKAGAEASTEGHRNEWATSVGDFLDRPQGGGLGSTTASVRFEGVDRSNGNAYLLMGNELGALGLVLFVALLVLTAGAVAGRLRHGPAPPTWVVGTALLAVGLAVAGTTHHVLENLAVAWALWLLLGLACRHHTTEAEASASRDSRARPWT